MNLAPARPLRGAGVEPTRQRLEALLLLPALLVVAAAPRHGLARVVVGKLLADHAVVALIAAAVAAVFVALGGRTQMTSKKSKDIWDPNHLFYISDQ